MRITYSPNNSGGDWWLTETQWKSMEAAGWNVYWEEFLGSPAREATIEAHSMQDAIDVWVRATGANPDEPGCDCCGQPHYFRIDSTAYTDEEARSLSRYDDL